MESAWRCPRHVRPLTLMEGVKRLRRFFRFVSQIGSVRVVIPLTKAIYLATVPGVAGVSEGAGRNGHT
jgi:hypothetical protein